MYRRWCPVEMAQVIITQMEKQVKMAHFQYWGRGLKFGDGV